MSPSEHEALIEVEQVCQADVERHCQPPKEAISDPILNWMMAPERMAPPIMHPQAMDPFDPINMGPLLDNMMDSALRMQTMMQPEEPAFVIFFDFSEEVIPAQLAPDRAPEERALDSMVSKLVQHSNCDQMKQQMQMQPEETQDITHHIRLKGQKVLGQENVPEDRLRLARRLTEVTPEEVMKMQHHHDHPPRHHGHHYDDDEGRHICPKKHKCLMNALEQKLLQPDCAVSLTRMENVHRMEIIRMEETETYMAMFQLYCVLFFALFSMIIIRRMKNGKVLFLMRLRILQAVYSNPEIKAKVEDEVGVPLGNVPPLPTPVLRLLSADGRRYFSGKRERFFRLLTVMFILLTLDACEILPPRWPLFMMGSCCVFLVFKMVRLCFSKPEVRECDCCCCGGSTSDVQNGTVSDAQACCSCCKGSGICSVKCRTCCGTSGNDKDGGGCCGGSCGCSKDNNCDGDCGCCTGDSKSTAACILKQPLLLVVDDCCCCCCCDGSTLDVLNGTVSEAQACCTCCKGTGKCAPKCSTCCKDNDCDGDCGCCGDDEGKSCKRKVIVEPELAVYEGIQIV